MREAFIARLPDRLAVLRTLLTDIERGRHASLEVMHRAAHSLAGSAGVHQLIPISEAARNLERIAAARPVDGVLDEHGLHAMRKALANLEAQAVNPSHGFVPQRPKERTEVPRIVVVDDDEVQTGWLRSVLERAGYRADVFHELAAFAAADLTTEPPDGRHYRHGERGGAGYYFLD